MADSSDVWCLAAQSCLTVWTLWTVALQAPLSMGIFQARILEWVAKIPHGGGPSQPRKQTHVSYVSHVSRQVLYHRTTGEV